MDRVGSAALTDLYSSSLKKGTLISLIISPSGVHEFTTFGPIPPTWKTPPKSESELTEFEKSLFASSLQNASYTSSCRFTDGLPGTYQGWTTGKPIATITFTDSRTGVDFVGVSILRDTGQVVGGYVKKLRGNEE